MVFNGNCRYEECSRIVLCRIKRCNVITPRSVPLQRRIRQFSHINQTAQARKLVPRTINAPPFYG
jgi:hypothetical protein